MMSVPESQPHADSAADLRQCAEKERQRAIAWTDHAASIESLTVAYDGQDPAGIVLLRELAAEAAHEAAACRATAERLETLALALESMP